MAFLALTEGPLAVIVVMLASQNVYRKTEGDLGERGPRIQRKEKKTYAARFCAFRRDCAGVRPFSFSSLLPRVVRAPLLLPGPDVSRIKPSMPSPPKPLSTLPMTTGIGD